MLQPSIGVLWHVANSLPQELPVETAKRMPIQRIVGGSKFDLETTKELISAYRAPDNAPKVSEDHPAYVCDGYYWNQMSRVGKISISRCLDLISPFLFRYQYAT